MTTTHTPRPRGDQPDECRYFIGRDGVFATLYDRLLAAAATPGPDNGGAA